MALDTRSKPRPVGVTPPPRPLGLWASYRAARRNLLELIPEPAYREPVLRGGRTGRPGWMMLMDPDGLEHVLKGAETGFPKSDVTLRILRPREGESLFTSTGAAWRWQHRAMTPMFQHRALLGIAPVMTAAAEAAAGRIAAQASDGPVDLYAEMVQATCDVICDAALSGRESLDRAALTDGVTRFITGPARVSLLDILGAPQWIPRPGRLLDRAGPKMDARMDAIIEARLARGPGDPPDMLDLLIGAADPKSGRSMGRIELRNNLLAFIVAGHETTALALAWALYLLALHPERQEEARTVAREALGDRAATAEDLPALAPLRRVIEEALRLYPPAAFMTRQAEVEAEVAGHRIAPGCLIMIPIYAIHRHRRLWDDPDAFDPDRFRPERARGRHKFAYLPFSGGPRICIGMAFALMEAQIILATLLARFAVALPAGRAPRLQMTFTLRPEGGLPLEVRRL